MAGRNAKIIDEFCRGLSICRRKQGFYRGEDWHICYFFSVRVDAELFRDRFDGEFIDPKDRPKWPGASKRSS